MVVSWRAAICGVVITLAVSSAAMARTKIHSVHSYSINETTDGATIVGAASMYNPYRHGYQEGPEGTASGQRYDPSEWAAAIQADLRQEFGGVRSGKKPKYALVEAGDKKAIIKINDVGPLKPGRIIDFNERTMRYFDSTLQKGVIHTVRVIP